MKHRFLEGQLVQITAGFRSPPVFPTLGIIVKVLERNEQNPEWDKFLVMWSGQVDALPGRRLTQISSEILSNLVQN